MAAKHRVAIHGECAPRFEAVPEGASVLARHAGEPVLVREGRILLSAFHPELTTDGRVHRLLASL